MNNSRFKLYLIITLVLSGLLPIIGSTFLHFFQFGRYWIDEPLHSVFEALGSFTALSLALLILTLKKNKGIPSYYIWVSCALIGMGLLDLFHAFSPPGDSFVWLHGMAILIGGFLFAMVWLPDHIAQSRLTSILPTVVAVVAIIFGVFAVAFPDTLPSMVNKGVFTTTANTINILSGLFFLLASVYFVTRYRSKRSIEDFLFANFCLLNSWVGLLFPFSQLWYADWWFWHLLRLIAYFTVVSYMFITFQRSEAELEQHREHLEELVQKRTTELKITNEQLHQEIDERIRVEEALWESKQRWATTLASIGDAVISTDIEGRITFMNAVAEELTGWILAEASTKPVKEVFNIINEYTRAEVEDPAIRVLQEGTIIGLANHTILVRKDGTEVPIDDSSAPIREGDGKVMGVVLVFRDITERKQAEKEKDRFFKAFASSTDGITIADENDRFIYVNEAYAKIFSYCQEELIGNTWRKITPPEMIAPTEKGLSSTMHNKDIGIFHGEVSGLRKDGTIIPTEVRGKGIWDENGNYQGHICVVNDITERKRMEEKLRKAHDELEVRVKERTAELAEANEILKAEIIERKRAEEALKDRESKLSAMINCFEGLVYICSPDYRIEFMNEQFIKNYGPNKVIGELCYKVLQNRDSICPWCVNERVFRGETIRWEVQIPKDGPWYYAVNTPIYHQDGSISKQAMALDITERKRAEEKIQEQAALLDKAHDAIGVRDLEHNLIYWNKGAERLYGWTAEEAIGRNPIDFLFKDKEEPPQLVEAKRIVLERGEWAGELHQIKKDGIELIVESRWTLMHDGEGKPKSILVINTDVTEKKKLEAQLLRAQRMESIGTLAGGIAHDINNVLTPMMLSLQLLQEKFTDDESQKLLNILERSAQRGASLVKQVQSFARGVRGERVALRVSHLISEITQIAKETFSRSIEIKTDIPKDLWIISGDATQLHQVLMNLCVNARDAMPDGGVLSISAENIFIDENYARMNIDAKVGQYVVITVSDTGTGIPPGILDRIFEPFFTTKQPGKGTGLGLSTSLAIVKSHGGFISVYSEVGKGTAFKVYLPVVKTTEVQKVDEQLELLTGHGELILVVDDEAMVREITSSILETHGYRVLTANDGNDAIKVYTQNREKIKVILMDMMMPVMDGQTCIRALRRVNPDIKIIAVSGLAEKEKLRKIAITHVKAFLSKPYVAKKLLKTIHEVINAK